MRYRCEILNHGIDGYEVWLHGRNQGRSGVKDPWGPCSDKLTDSLSHIPPNHRNAQQDIPSITQNKY